MPVPDHPYLDRATRKITAAYTRAETAIITAIADRIRADIGADDWADRKLGELAAFQAQVKTTVAELAPGTGIARAVTAAQQRALDITTRELPPIAAPRRPITVSNLVAQAELAATLAPVPRRIAITGRAIYLAVVGAAISIPAADAANRLTATQRTLTTLARHGVTGFIDRTGRSWEMNAYVEMATRTGLANTMLAAQDQQLAQLGLDLVIVDDASQECQKCRPWEGAVLSLSGRHSGTVTATDPLTGDDVQVAVDGSLSQARSAGLYHPNCRHSHSSYLPGVTQKPTNTVDVEGDKDRQKLRYQERQLRSYRRAEAAAITPEARQEAQNKIVEWRTKLKNHVESTTAKRQPRREYISAPH